MGKVVPWAMSPLTRASLLIFLITIISAVALSFLSRAAVCVFLAPHIADAESLFVYGPSLHNVHQHFCTKSRLPDRQDDWDLFYHLGGNGPWIEKKNARFGTYEKDGKPPEGCVVDQVHMV